MIRNALTNVNQPYCKVFNLFHKATPLANVIPTGMKALKFLCNCSVSLFSFYCEFWESKPHGSCSHCERCNLLMQVCVICESCVTLAESNEGKVV